ncbi:diaminopropionate ammonia-lyase [Photobacterium lutimaris]|uniref:Diaminopropionate ammonia-lyase n=1 Tax=Photobacterium lutimaris TaxID=388278 RepID=A0A2T3IL65_9GAMM|nr:diaminopropionate ammonia-lyase [Photobacterium lutimaris]PSU29059.1 diaminopropionate ammonia-lyase [Photobacterium lutimaris]TDR75666.1 diaminopropionate ammonia-lyase [Photobacterium lutimaris]
MSTFTLKMEIADNRHYNGQLSPLFTAAEAEKARAFHQAVEGYQPTPLHSLDCLAKAIGVGKILVKDEAYRFDLNAFKMLGGAYAIARLLCDEFKLDINAFDFAKLKNDITEKMTFATATDGNHGRGVAWAANKLGQNAVVYMPKGAADERVNNIRALGAECIVTDMNYDDTVRLAIKTADENGWKVVQDTAWEGYTEIPTWIMQGYTTMAAEAVDQMKAMTVERPTHVFLQAGVGAMAGGVLGYLCDQYGPDKLHSVVVEPDQADCIYRSGISEKGEMINVDGDLATIMVGLACGEPNPIGWPVLRDCSTQFVSCQDSVAALGMRVLGNPLGSDPRVVSGESGAVGAGLLAAVHFHPEKDKLMEKMGLNKDSVVLLINTEGDTDPVHYREVVWGGKHQTI